MSQQPGSGIVFQRFLSVAADSPVVKTHGHKNQIYAGIDLIYAWQIMMFKNVRLFILVTIIFLGGDLASANEPGKLSPKHVTSGKCASCHVEETKQWSNSHHAWAWKFPTPETVLGDFNNTRFGHKGIVSKFTKRDDKYFVETDGVDGKLTIFEVKGTIGVTPLQQYIVETEPGRLQSLDVVWDTIKRRWYHLYPNQDVGAGNGLHWTGPYKNWNSRCAECHATDFQKNFDIQKKTYSSVSSEIGVGCEACHGPGEAHVKWASAPTTFDALKWTNVSDRGLTVNFSRSSEKSEIERCAQCHSRREPLGASSPPAHEAFDGHYRLANLRNGLYHADGQILDEVYVYGSFLQSKMHQRGVRCSDCHNSHSGELKAAGNVTCTQCHSPAGNERFPTLRKGVFDGPEHHFHKADSSGAKCANCHMPERLYMVIDGRRDHSFRIPRPDLSMKIGTPNACTDCHDDKKATWAAGYLEKWYPKSLNRNAHFGEIIDAGRKVINQQTAEGLMVLANDTANPVNVRATALDLLRPHNSPAIAQRMTKHLEDPSPVVRSAAVVLQRSAPMQVRLRFLVPMLNDPVLSVRISVARAMLGIRGVRFPPKIAQEMQTVMTEYRQSLLAKADFPESQLAIAGTALVLRNLQAAIRAFSEAVRMDPQLVQAWLTQARILVALKDVSAAEKVLETAITHNPTDGNLFYNLGQLQVSLGETNAAISSFEKAISLMPIDDRPKITLGIMMSRIGNHEKAIKYLIDISDINSTPPDVFFHLGMSYLALGEKDKANLAYSKLKVLFPQSPLNAQAGKLLNR